MNFNMSKRDSFLLFSIAIIGVVALLFQFILSPALLKQQTLLSEKGVLETQKLIIQTELPQLNTKEELLISRLDEVSSLIEVFEAPLHSAEFEHIILPIATDLDMKVTNSDFMDTEVIAPIALETFPKELQYNLGDLIKTYKDESIEPFSVPETSVQLLHTQYSYNFTSSYANFIYFIEAIRKMDTSIIINTASYDIELSDAFFIFDVYFLDQLKLDNIRVISTDVSADAKGNTSSNEDPHTSTK